MLKIDKILGLSVLVYLLYLYCSVFVLGESLRKPRFAQQAIRYTAPIAHDDVIAIQNLSGSFNPVVLEVRDNKDARYRHVLTGGWLAPKLIYLLPVVALSGESIEWQGTLWIFSQDPVNVSVGTKDHIHRAIKVPEHFGLQVDSYWEDLRNDPPSD